MPIFLLALPAGALADILDRRLFILGTQTWMLRPPPSLTVLTYAGLTDPTLLLALTFAIGVGSAMNSPAWGSVMAEAVPRRDLVQAIALNSVGFNLARAIGPAIAGVLVLAGRACAGLRAERRFLPRGGRRAAHLAPPPPPRRAAARALHQRHARRHAVHPPHPGDAGRHGALGRLFRHRRRALGDVAAGGARATAPRAPACSACCWG